MNIDNKTETQAILKRGAFFFSSVFGIGFIKFAPGTLGSIVALPLVWFMMLLGGIEGLLICLLFVGLFGYAVTAMALRYTDDEDPSFIVIDEVVAQMMVFIPSIIFFPEYTWHPVMYIMGFALFRLFDIVKPLHVGEVDRNIHGAFGVMLDDIIAAFYASVLTVLGMLVFSYISLPA